MWQREKERRTIGEKRRSNVEGERGVGGRTDKRGQREDDVSGKRGGGSKQTASSSSDGHQDGLEPRDTREKVNLISALCPQHNKETSRLTSGWGITAVVRVLHPVI